jgi:hypothetical protein
MDFKQWLISEETIRLYRAHHENRPITPPPVIPAEEIDSPFGKIGLPADPTIGRWFHSDWRFLKHKFGNRPMYYVDVPLEVANRSRARTGTPGSFVLPDEWVARAQLARDLLD